MKNFYNSLLIIVFLLLNSCSKLPNIYSALKSKTVVIKKHDKRRYNKPYIIKGIRYYPRPYYEYSEVGLASFYGGKDIFHGRPTSTGEIFHKNGFTAAHKTLPLPCVVRVTNLSNGRSIILRVNDRGPFVKKRIIDVSAKASSILGFFNQGLTKVRVDCLVYESIVLAKNYKPLKCHFQDVLCKKQIFNFSSSQVKKISTKTMRKYVQIAKYSSLKEAQQFARKVTKKLKLKCKIGKYTHKNKIQYRILMGPIPSDNYGKKLLNILYKRNVKDAFILKVQIADKK